MEKEMKRVQGPGFRNQGESPTRPYMLLVTFLLVTAAYAATTDEAIDDIQKRLTGIKDIKGAFSQTSYLKDLERTETYAGEFFIKKPSCVMWEYKTPRDEKIIISGTDTWVYKRSQNQAIRTRFSKEAYGQVPIALLNSLDNIKADFDVTRMEQDTLILKPKNQMGLLQEIQMKISPKNFPVRSLRALDVYGNIVSIELTDVKTNTGLESAMFNFTPPAGVEVFDMSQ